MVWARPQGFREGPDGRSRPHSSTAAGTHTATLQHGLLWLCWRLHTWIPLPADPGSARRPFTGVLAMSPAEHVGCVHTGAWNFVPGVSDERGMPLPCLQAKEATFEVDMPRDNGVDVCCGPGRHDIRPL